MKKKKAKSFMKFSYSNCCYRVKEFGLGFLKVILTEGPLDTVRVALKTLPTMLGTCLAPLGEALGEYVTFHFFAVVLLESCHRITVFCFPFC